MKKVEFTNEELRTLIWAINNQYHDIVRKRGKKEQSDVEKRLLSISKKVYGKLVE